jgi:hypothetical protein
MNLHYAPDIDVDGLKITGVVNTTKGFGLVQIFAAGNMVYYEYTKPEMLAVETLMKQKEAEVWQ